MAVDRQAAPPQPIPSHCPDEGRSLPQSSRHRDRIPASRAPPEPIGECWPPHSAAPAPFQAALQRTSRRKAESKSQTTPPPVSPDSSRAIFLRTPLPNSFLSSMDRAGVRLSLSYRLRYLLP